MEKIRIKNLRSLRDTGNIELKPLTVVVGKNSSGKSTILRTFPLFKQTLETKVADPILWYGRYVDFGDYKQSRNRHAEQELIEFEFEFETFLQYSEQKEKLNLKFNLDKKNIKYVNIR